MSRVHVELDLCRDPDDLLLVEPGIIYKWITKRTRYSMMHSGVPFYGSLQHKSGFNHVKGSCDRGTRASQYANYS